MPDQWVTKLSFQHLQLDFLNEKGEIRIKEEKSRLPVDVRGSKMSVLKLPIVFTVTQSNNKSKTIQWKKLRNSDVIKDTKVRQVVGLRIYTNFRYSSKCFAEIYRAQYENAILVYLRGTPIWRPENSVNIWNLLRLSRRLIISTEKASIYINTFANALTSKRDQNHEISIYFSTNSIVALCHPPP